MLKLVCEILKTNKEGDWLVEFAWTVFDRAGKGSKIDVIDEF